MYSSPIASNCLAGHDAACPISLLSGDKTGDPNWYVDAQRRAEAIYARHLIEIGEQP